MKKFAEKTIFVIVTGFAVSAFAESTSKLAKAPIDIADIVGRDLDIFLLGQLGHVGLWTGKNVLEALNSTPAINENSLQNFKSRSQYWGAVYYPNWHLLPYDTMPSKPTVPYIWNSHPPKLVAVKRAELIRQIGATYTVSPKTSAAQYQSCAVSRCTGPTPGVYRCDTYIKDALSKANVPGITFDITDTPSSLYSAYQERR